MTLVLLLAVTAMSFAQKSEIKAIEKAIKSKNWADAQSAVSAADKLTSNMDDKTKAKYYYVKAQALYADGTGSNENIDKAIESLAQLKDLEANMGKLKYTKNANEMKTEMVNSFLTKANNAISSKDYGIAAIGFEKAYKLSPQDTTYLYYAASSAVTDQDYDKALEYYIELQNLDYTGIKMNYYATNKESGEEEIFGDKKTRDLTVSISKTHINPRDEMSMSKRGEITKNIALIYVSQGKDEKALGAISEARAENPNDMGLLLSEANIYFKLGNNERFKELMEEATSKDPNNAELQYNLGVLAAEAGDQEQAVKYYKKAIELNPNYVDAYNNIAVSILDGEAAIVEEMNSLGMSAADNKRYDELKEKRTNIYKEAVPYLEKALELKKTNVNAAQTLMNIYSALGETDKYNEMKAKLESIESAAIGN